jgi:hypothetical protein
MRVSLKYGWNARRVIYTIVGAVIMIRFYLNGEWIGMLLGTYFFAMGLFGFGCAGGNCSVPQNRARSLDIGPSSLKNNYPE